MPASRHFLPIPPELTPTEARFQLLYRQLLEARTADERRVVREAIAELERRIAKRGPIP